LWLITGILNMEEKKNGSLGLFLKALEYLEPDEKNVEDAAAEEIEELKELEELEEFADLEHFEAHEPEEAPVPETHDEIHTDEPASHLAANLYTDSFIPVVIIDKKMRILFTNDACKKLFTGYVNLSGKYFADVFGKPFGIVDIRKIHDAITEGQNGYFWKGEVRMKSRDVISVQIKVFIFPADPNAADPAEFIVLFEDVTEENKKSTMAIFEGLLRASQSKDNDTGKHILRVNHYSRRLAKELSKSPKYKRIDADFIDNIGLLASMHDVGKIGTRDDILNKEGPLSDEEWKEMRNHTIIGAYILDSYPNQMAKEIALSHHERWNGTGYPYQLSGEMIPLAARIVSIADVYDALRTVRSYKPAFPHEEAVKKILEGKEIQFDPFLMDIFTSVNVDFNHIYDENFDSL